MDRREKTASVISYVDHNRNSIESVRICAKILGQYNREVIDDEVFKELHARLPRAKTDIIDECYSMIQ